ncbi:MAG: cell division protein FtsQ/DivIB [Cellvibrionaceae bacterium]|nr:cell division protein FtsQ/DivIB [Cellvibrionaceae bacterium]
MSTNIEKRGAVRKASPVAREKIRWGYFLSIVVLLGLAAVLVEYGRQPLLEMADRPVAKVVVEGEFRHLNKDRVVKRLQGVIDRSFLQLKLDKIKAEIEADPWVERAVLSRRWPDQLLVQVVEQIAIARWEDTGFLSVRGEVIESEDATELLADLPLLHGPTESAAQVMENYKSFNQLLGQIDLSIVALRADERLSWQAQLSNNWRLELGRHEINSKIERLLRVYPRTLQEHAGRIEAIDLRYENGFSVSWREPLAELVVAN